MKLIPLTRGLVTEVDDDDFERFGHLRWYAQVSKTAFYASRRPGHRKPHTKLHRLIVGAVPGEVVDHIDGNTLNNRKSNLRFCSPSENTQNSRGRFRARRSKFKGLAWLPKEGRWRVQIKANGKRISLGVYGCEEEAARIYDKAALELHGQYARLNFFQARQP